MTEAETKIRKLVVELESLASHPNFNKGNTRKTEAAHLTSDILLIHDAHFWRTNPGWGLSLKDVAADRDIGIDLPMLTPEQNDKWQGQLDKLTGVDREDGVLRFKVDGRGSVVMLPFVTARRILNLFKRLVAEVSP